MDAQDDGPVGEIEAVLTLLAERRQVDLRDYRRPTLTRRIRARMEALGVPEVAGYRLRLADDPRELDQLVAALLIHFTAFFRDPAVFAALEKHVAPPLMAAAPGGPFRAWAIGAATGEEAFSLAMTLAAVAQARQVEWEIIATDRDETSVELARGARYPEDALANAVPPSMRERFFRREGSFLRASDELRSRIRFAVHDFMGPRLAPREAVLALFDLVLCRNVLIYMDDRFQEEAFKRLTAIVRSGGALVLGHTEALPSGLVDRFEPFPGLDAGLRIFRRRDR